MLHSQPVTMGPSKRETPNTTDDGVSAKAARYIDLYCYESPLSESSLSDSSLCKSSLSDSSLSDAKCELYTQDVIKEEGSPRDRLKQNFDHFQEYLRQEYELNETDIADVVDMMEHVHVRHTLWESVENLNTYDDPFAIVFLFKVWDTTKEYFFTLSSPSLKNHAATCLYLMYTLYAPCVAYFLKPFVEKSECSSGDELMSRVLDVIDKTAVTSMYFSVINQEKECVEELHSYH